MARTGQWNRNGKIKLFLDDKEVNPTSPAGARPVGLGPGQGQGTGGRRAGPPPIRLERGRKYPMRVEYQQDGSRGGAELDWIPPATAMLAEAEKTAKDSDVALVFVGLNGTQEGEGHDRVAIELPEPQEILVKTIIATGKPVVVVLTSGSAVAMNSAASGAAAVLSAWYGGEEAGTSIAETLAGVSNPSGRLPVTLLQEHRSAAFVYGLRHEGPDLPVLHRRTAVSVRLWNQLFDICVFRPNCETDRNRRRDPGDGEEHVLTGRRRSGAVVLRGGSRGCHTGAQPARVPADSSSGWRGAASSLHRGCRRLAKVDNGNQRWGWAACGWHTACNGLAVKLRVLRW